MIIIEHTHADGTTLHGSRTGDGVYEIVREHNFTWRRNVGIFIRGSRDKNAQEHKINTAVEALRAAGHEVTVNIDNTWRPTAEREADRAERADVRAERLTDRAERAGQRSEAHRDASDRITDHIPFGQPILVGHHSERGHRRAMERVHANTHKAIDAAKQARSLTNRAQAVDVNLEHRNNPRVTMRRIERLEAEGRDVARQLSGYRNNLGDVFTPATPGSDWHARLTEKAAAISEEVAYWKAKLAEHAEQGTFVPWGPEHFVKGDRVKVLGTWHRVRRVNRKSVSVPWDNGRMGVESEHSTTVPWDEVVGRRRDGMQLDTPNGEPWPVELAVKVARWRDLSQRGQTQDNAERVRWAQRLVHGLELSASASEVAAFQPDENDVTACRSLAAAYVDMFERLKQQEKPADIRAEGPTWTGTTPTWTMPDGEPTQVQVRDVKLGDIVKGVYDDQFLRRTFAGPVAEVIPHVGDEYSGERFIGYWTVRLTHGAEKQFRPYNRLAVFPAPVGEGQDARAEDATAENDDTTVGGMPTEDDIPDDVPTQDDDISGAAGPAEEDDDAPAAPPANIEQVPGTDPWSLFLAEVVAGGTAGGDTPPTEPKQTDPWSRFLSELVAAR